MTKSTYRPLHGISRKADEQIRLYQLRENKTTTLGNFANQHGDKNPPRYVKGGAVLLPKKEGQVQAFNPVSVTRPGPYRTGDGDTNTAMRPGADDHKKYQSLSSKGTASYNDRGHT